MYPFNHPFRIPDDAAQVVPHPPPTNARACRPSAGIERFSSPTNGIFSDA